jgi:predicted amidohydrolase
MRVAAAQMDVKLADRDANMATIERLLQDAASQDVDLIVFPECALSGYAYDRLEEALSVADDLTASGGR